MTGTFDPLAVLTESARVWWRNLTGLVLLTLCIQLPLVALALVVKYLGLDLELKENKSLSYLALGLSALLGVLMATAPVAAVAAWRQGLPLGLWESVRIGCRRLPVVCPAVFLVLLLFFVGFSLFVLPGLIVMATFWLIIPLSVLEGRGIKDSLLCSAWLVQGRRWQLFALILLLSCIDLVPTFLLILLCGQDQGSLFVGNTLFGVFPRSLMAVTMTMAYMRMREIRDGDHHPGS